jgi:lysophospholipase L1-like esterase
VRACIGKRQPWLEIVLLVLVLVAAAAAAGCGAGTIESSFDGGGVPPGSDGASGLEAGGGGDGGVPGDAVPGTDGTPPDGTVATDGQGQEDAPPALAQPRLIGRFDTSDPSGAVFGWSGSAIEARFSGTGITLRMSDPSSTSDSNRYSIVIDDGTPEFVEINSSRQSWALASGLADTPHKVVVWRDTEWSGGEANFLGFDLEAGGQYLPTPALNRRIEVIGDSITCGYGDIGAGPNCPYKKNTQQHYETYEAVAARSLEADLITICVSGIGIYQGYGGDTSFIMPPMYPRTLPNRDTPAWSFSSWVPHAVVINLGTNDWSTGSLAESNFKTPYRAFLDTIRGHYPDAWLFLAVGPMLGGTNYGTTRDWLTQLIAERAGETRMSVVEFGTQDGSLGLGCDWHPSVGEHAYMAGILEDLIRQKLGW